MRVIHFINVDHSSDQSKIHVRHSFLGSENNCDEEIDEDAHKPGADNGKSEVKEGMPMNLSLIY